MFEKEDRLT